MIVLTPGLILPAFSAASIIETPMRILHRRHRIEEFELVPGSPRHAVALGRRLRRTRGVAPMVSVMAP